MGLTVTVCWVGLKQLLVSPAQRETMYVPAVVYTCVGFCCTELPPSPKSQSQVLMVDVEDDVKLVGCPMQLGLGSTVKDISGTSCTVTSCETVSLHPYASVA